MAKLLYAPLNVPPPIKAIIVPFLHLHHVYRNTFYMCRMNFHIISIDVLATVSPPQINTQLLIIHEQIKSVSLAK